MILEERQVTKDDIGDLFKTIAEELKKNVNSQVVVNKKIIDIFKKNGEKYHIFIHNYADNYEVKKWYTLHESHSYSKIISKLGIRDYDTNSYQITRFTYNGYNFANKPYRKGEYIYYEHEAQRILSFTLKN